MSQPPASENFKVLREAGLVTVVVDGPRRPHRVSFAA
jgi:hypothetical protein